MGSIRGRAALGGFVGRRISSAGWRRLRYLSLSTGAEVMHGPDGASCELPVETYTGVAGLAWRLIQAPITIMKLSKRLRRLDPQLAVCAMPGPLDLLMILALHRFGIPAAVIVHDAEAHPGDRIPLLQMSQRALLRRADLVILLSMHVAERLRANGSLRPATPIIVASLPPLSFGAVAPLAARAGPRRLLCFGRLRAYKGTRSPGGGAAIAGAAGGS